MDTHELAWAAGLFDGEGWTSAKHALWVVRNNPPDKRKKEGV